MFRCELSVVQLEMFLTFWLCLPVKHIQESGDHQPNFQYAANMNSEMITVIAKTQNILCYD